MSRFLKNATFPILIVVVLAFFAQRFLGQNEEKPKPNLELARHHIDMLAVLQQKTRGNLTLEEQRGLDNTLTELRFRFVQVSEELAKTAAQKA